MTTMGFTLRRLRALDLVLIALIVLVGAAGGRAALASSIDRDGSTVPEPAREPPSSRMPVPDDNTLAAMIAAENAALTIPQYLVDLPAIAR